MIENLKQKTKLLVLFIGFLDILAIGIFVPIMPELAIYYDVSAINMSYSIALYALFSFLSGPILGQLSDKYGRKKILLLCIIGTIISNLIMSLTNIFFIFILARIINGLTGGNISIVQSILSDISKDKIERTKNMGLIGMLFGLGFIIGPIIGAILIGFGTKAPFWLMTILSVIEIFIIIFLLQETNHNKTTEKINRNPFLSITKYIKLKNVNLFIISFFILMLVSSTYQGMFPLFLDKNYDITGQQIGYVMAGVGVVVAFNQGFLMKRFWLAKFSLKNLFIITNIGLFVFFVILSFLTNLSLFLVAFYTMVIFSGIVNPIYSAEIVEYTSDTKRGEVMGVLSSLSSVTMFIGPIFAGILIDKNISIFIGGAILVGISLSFLSKIYKLLK